MWSTGTCRALIGEFGLISSLHANAVNLRPALLLGYPRPRSIMLARLAARHGQCPDPRSRVSIHLFDEAVDESTPTQSAAPKWATACSPAPRRPPTRFIRVENEVTRECDEMGLGRTELPTWSASSIPFPVTAPVTYRHTGRGGGLKTAWVRDQPQLLRPVQRTMAIPSDAWPNCAQDTAIGGRHLPLFVGEFGMLNDSSARGQDRQMAKALQRHVRALVEWATKALGLPLAAPGCSRPGSERLPSETTRQRQSRYGLLQRTGPRNRPQ